MMRSGFQKPGAIPLLALIILLLLSLVPSLAKEWDYNLQFGYIGYGLPRTKDVSVDLRSRIRATETQRKEWSIDGSYQLCPDHKSRPRRGALDSSPLVSIEMAPVLDNEAITPTIKASSTLTRGVHAFKTFFIKRLDDYQILQPFTTKNMSSAQTGSRIRLTSTVANSSITQVPQSSKDSVRRPYGSNQTMPDTKYALESSRLRFFSDGRDAWQWACLAAGNFLETYFRAANGSSTAEPPVQFNQLHEEKVHSSAAPPDDHNVQPTPADSLAMSTRSPNLATTVAGHPKDAGFDGNSEHMRGSFMAIVIGLVAGVLWF